MLLIYPPVAKPCEPPGGLARIAGALKQHNLDHQLLDANLEGLYHRIEGPTIHSDKWTQRSKRHLTTNLISLMNGRAFQNLDYYKRSVGEINRLAQKAHPSFDVTLSLVNYEDRRFSPLRSSDLIRSAEKPDQNPFYPYFKSRLDELLTDADPSIVGISLNYRSQVLCAFAMAGYLRKKAPKIRIIMGGGLITSWLANPDWKNPFAGLIDTFISGPGEPPLLSCRGIEEKNKSYRPSFMEFKDLRYLSPGFILPYSASMGCFWNRCSFCPESAEGNRFRPIPHQQVIKEINLLIQETNPVMLHFLDNAVPPALLRQIIAHPLPIPWYGFVRLTKELRELDFCLALKRSGCVMLKLGLESGDQSVLDQMDKGIQLEDVSLILKNLKRAGIRSYVYLLFGTPPENLAAARRTLEFTVRHSDLIGFLNLAIFNLPLSSQVARHLDTEDFYEGDLSLYRQFRHPLGWNRQIVRQFLDREFKRQPAVAAILRRDPPFFTSNHAPFFQ